AELAALEDVAACLSHTCCLRGGAHHRASEACIVSLGLYTGGGRDEDDGEAVSGSRGGGCRRDDEAERANLGGRAGRAAGRDGTYGAGLADLRRAGDAWRTRDRRRGRGGHRGLGRRRGLGRVWG